MGSFWFSSFFFNFCRARYIRYFQSCVSLTRNSNLPSRFCGAIRKARDPTTYSGPVPSIESVAHGLVFPSPDMLSFRHPDHFLAGNLNF